MNSELRNSPPIWFWLIAIAALAWNGLGLVAFLGQMQMSAEALAALPEIEQDMYNSTPIWVNIAFGAAVIFGVLGSLALLLRNNWATNLYLVSLLAVLVQMTYMFFFSGIFQLKGWEMAIMPASVIVVSLLLWSYALKASARHWIY